MELLYINVQQGCTLGSCVPLLPADGCVPYFSNHFGTVDRIEVIRRVRAGVRAERATGPTDALSDPWHLFSTLRLTSSVTGRPCSSELQRVIGCQRHGCAGYAVQVVHTSIDV